MSEERFVITTDEKPTLVNLVRSLPAILTGRVPDQHGIAAGFRARIGYTILSLVAPNFDELGRGGVGADGTKWPDLSPEYLAYGRRFGPGEKSALKAASGVPRGANKAPGTKRDGTPKEGLLTDDQLRLWRQIYADRLAWYEMRESDASAKAHAAAVAWIIVKARGGKTKLEVYGRREVQMLVDTGYLRGSIQPGLILESGVEASYQKPTGNGGDQQVFDISEGSRIVLGSNVVYAAPNHKRRPLWPKQFPKEWWDQILGAAISGLTRIHELFRNT